MNNTFLQEETLVKIWKECSKKENEPSDKFLSYIEHFKNDRLFKKGEKILEYEKQKKIALKYLNFFKDIYGNEFYLRPRHAPNYKEEGFLLAHSYIALDFDQEIKVKDIIPSPKKCPYRFNFKITCSLDQVM